MVKRTSHKIRPNNPFVCGLWLTELVLDLFPYRSTLCPLLDLLIQVDREVDPISISLSWLWGKFSHWNQTKR